MTTRSTTRHMSRIRIGDHPSCSAVEQEGYCETCGAPLCLGDAAWWCRRREALYCSRKCSELHTAAS